YCPLRIMGDDFADGDSLLDGYNFFVRLICRTIVVWASLRSNLPSPLISGSLKLWVASRRMLKCLQKVDALMRQPTLVFRFTGNIASWFRLWTGSTAIMSRERLKCKKTPGGFPSCR